MNPKINIKAKISRHSRIYKDSILSLDNKSSQQYSFSYKLVLVIVVFIFPLYPAFANLVYSNTETDFDRNGIDESSIISSEMFIDDSDTVTISNSDDGSFLSVSTIGDGTRNLEGINEIIVYEVKSGDSVESIASKYGVSANSVYRSNDLTRSSIIHPGDILRVPPVNGIVYKIQKGDTIEGIAKRHSTELEKVLAQNGITTSTTIIAGEYLVLPDAKPYVPPPPPKPVVTQNPTPTRNTGTQTSNSSSTYVDDGGEYTLTRRGGANRFVRGNCTRYVAQYKNVTWRGNANQWLANARAVGVPTGSNPVAGAIIVFSGRNGYNPRYGHVGIVTSVGSDSLIIKDMNYRALGEVTTRKISRYDSAIMGYIYAD